MAMVMLLLGFWCEPVLDAGLWAPILVAITAQRPSTFGHLSQSSVI